MLKLALQSSDWIKLSGWEVKQETWTRTKHTLQYHQVQFLLNIVLLLFIVKLQNQVNAALNYSVSKNENEVSWLPENLWEDLNGNVQVKLLCGADLLESFVTPGLWSNDDVSNNTLVDL